MISIASPSSTYPKRSGQVPSADVSRLQASSQAVDSARRLRAVRLRTCAGCISAGLEAAHAHKSPTASSESIQHISDGSVQSQTLCQPASIQTSTRRRKVHQPSATLRRPTTGPSGEIHSGACVTKNLLSGEEEQQKSAPGMNVPLRSADKDDQEQLPNSETQGADASMTTITASAIEPASNQAQWPQEATASPSRQSGATLTSTGLLRRPSFNLHRRLAPLSALRDSGLLESSTSPYSSGLRSIKIGIETEFYLAGLQKWLNHSSLDGFTAVLTRQHNQQVPVQHSRMQEYLRPYYYQGPYTEWCLVKEESLMSFGIPWGVELVSPLFRAFPGSRWREDVEATWAYLSANYDIAGNASAGTHIHIGLEPDYSLTDLKRIAQAVIHFETAFEALVPRCRRGNIHAKSNWLNAPGLAQSGRSRPKSIAAIENVICLKDLVDLLHPTLLPSGQYDRSFSWNFCSLYDKRSIEFRKPPASLSSKDALSWTELAMSFVQASSRVVSSEELQKIPPTVGGLRWFLQNFGNEPRVNQPGRLERLWRSAEPGAILEPKCQVSGLPEQEKLQLEARLQKIVLADRRRIEEIIKTAHGVYW